MIILTLAVPGVTTRAYGISFLDVLIYSQLNLREVVLSILIEEECRDMLLFLLGNQKISDQYVR